MDMVELTGSLLRPWRWDRRAAMAPLLSRLAFVCQRLSSCGGAGHSLHTYPAAESSADDNAGHSYDCRSFATPSHQPLQRPSTCSSLSPLDSPSGCQVRNTTHPWAQSLDPGHLPPAGLQLRRTLQCSHTALASSPPLRGFALLPSPSRSGSAGWNPAPGVQACLQLGLPGSPLGPELRWEGQQALGLRGYCKWREKVAKKVAKKVAERRREENQPSWLRRGGGPNSGRGGAGSSKGKGVKAAKRRAALARQGVPDEAVWPYVEVKSLGKCTVAAAAANPQQRPLQDFAKDAAKVLTPLGFRLVLAVHRTMQSVPVVAAVTPPLEAVLQASIRKAKGKPVNPIAVRKICREAVERSRRQVEGLPLAQRVGLLVRLTEELFAETGTSPVEAIAAIAKDLAAREAAAAAAAAAAAGEGESEGEDQQPGQQGVDAAGGSGAGKAGEEAPRKGKQRKMLEAATDAVGHLELPQRLFERRSELLHLAFAPVLKTWPLNDGPAALAAVLQAAPCEPLRKSATRPAGASAAEAAAAAAAAAAVAASSSGVARRKAVAGYSPQLRVVCALLCVAAHLEADSTTEFGPRNHEAGTGARVAVRLAHGIAGGEASLPGSVLAPEDIPLDVSAGLLASFDAFEFVHRDARQLGRTWAAIARPWANAVAPAEAPGGGRAAGEKGDADGQGTEKEQQRQQQQAAGVRVGNPALARVALRSLIRLRWYEQATYERLIAIASRR